MLFSWMSPCSADTVFSSPLQTGNMSLKDNRGKVLVITRDDHKLDDITGICLSNHRAFYENRDNELVSEPASGET